MTTEPQFEESETIVKEKVGRETKTNYMDDIKAIRNDVEQINELDQSLAVNCQDLAEEVTKILKINDKTLMIDVSERVKVTVTPNGYVLLKVGDHPPKPSPLAKLSPKLMDKTLKKLMPKLRESLKEQRRSREELATDLTRIRESLA